MFDPSEADFVAWLKEQDPTGRYYYWSYDCCFGKYLAARGVDYQSVGTVKYVLADGEVKDIPGKVADVLHTHRFELNTFGGVLKAMGHG